MCGPPGADPAAGLATPALRGWLADPANSGARGNIEATISASGTAGGCGPLDWAGPAVVPGPQTWAVAAAADGAGLDVAWGGSFGHVLADGDGRPEPWGTRAAATYRLVPADDGDGWLLSTWADGAHGRVAQGWPHDVVLPEGYLPAPQVPPSDPGALDAVRAAAAAWAAAPASTVTVEQASDGPDGGSTSSATAVAAPSRGDAAGRTGDRETLWLDAGRRVLVRQPGGQWTERNGAEPVEGGVSAPVSPFAVVALLADADGAVPSRCPDGLAAARCWTAAVATSRPGVPLSADTALARRAGIPWLVLNAGTDEKGRPAFVRLVQQAPAFGRTHATLVSTARFTGYADQAPPPPTVPGPDAVAPARDGQP